jgi:acyl-CoA synthetase (AMP-forming)/AMP-acid ligase II
MIKVGGENVSAAEVEAALSELPGIVEVAVVGVPHAKYGEVPVAFLRSDHAMNLDDVRARLRNSIASFKVPDRFVPVDEFPRSSTGKIMKAELRRTASDEMRAAPS